MMELEADVAIVGAGFGGSLAALILKQSGLRPVLIERGAHPRIVLGESSTPLASLIFESLINRFDLPRLKPLTKYGPWCRAYPQITRGLKRGFSYFQHESRRPFTPRPHHENELLVEANSDVEHAETHWLRSDFDHFLVQEAQAAGIPYFDRTSTTALESNGKWILKGTRLDVNINIAADFLIDASGDGGVIAKSLGIVSTTESLRSNSRAIYSHFREVARWQDVFNDSGGSAADHPFPCDDAALHHVFDGGWMWVLRFDNGLTSAGFCLDASTFPHEKNMTPADEWQRTLARFPSIQAQFAHAVPIYPIKCMQRVQRRFALAAGNNWAMLPTTAGIIDAFFSTGNAHTLLGIERLVDILQETRQGNDRAARLRQYSSQVLSEIDFIDLLVAGCYQTFAQFELMTAFAMLYFVAATHSERLRREGLKTESAGFLMSGDPNFRAIATSAYEEVGRIVGNSSVTQNQVPGFVDELASSLQPYNRAGLFDAARRNMYPFPKETPI